jgi:hypothetical protein
LLNYETVNKILNLLENGVSQRKTAESADVSLSTVQRIASRKCSSTGQTRPVLDCFTALVNSEQNIPLELRGDTLRRYNEIHKQKEKENLENKKDTNWQL